MIQFQDGEPGDRRGKHALADARVRVASDCFQQSLRHGLNLRLPVAKSSLQAGIGKKSDSSGIQIAPRAA